MHSHVLTPPTYTPLGGQGSCAHLDEDLGWTPAETLRTGMTGPPLAPPCLPANEPWGPSGNSCSRWCPLLPAELTPALIAPDSLSFALGAACKPLTHAPAS